jgi:hypothetical protein
VALELTNDTTLTWKATTEPDLAGYEILWRGYDRPAMGALGSGRQGNPVHSAAP